MIAFLRAPLPKCSGVQSSAMANVLRGVTVVWRKSLTNTGKSELVSDRAGEALECRLIAGARRRAAPDRLRRQRVFLAAGNNVNETAARRYRSRRR